MASRYFIGTGTWDASSTTNWSATSGGATGASVPTSADDVFIDGLSGSSPVITTSGTINCLSLSFTGAITPTFAGGATLNVFGSLTLIAAMTFTYSGSLTFSATTTGKTITSAGKTFNSLVQISTVGGGWTLQDNFLSTGQLVIVGGSFVSNNKNITCVGFNISGSSVRSINLGSSIVTTSDSYNASITTNLTFTAGTSTIIVSGDNANFSGGGLTYYNVTLSGTPIPISGSNTFNILTLTAGKTVNITAGTNQTYTSLVANGTPSSKITIQSVTAGSAATMTRTSGIQVIRNITLKDITATGGATFYALGTTNVSGNTGWTYQMLIKQEKLSSSLMALYHIDSAGTMTKVSG